MRALRLIAINLGVILALVLGASLLCAVVLDVKAALQQARNDKEAVADADSPAYQDPAYGRQVLRDTQDSAVFDFHAFIEWRRRPYAGKTVNVDADGLRHQIHVDPHARRKVAFFGSSATWGSGVDDASTVPALFEKAAPGFLAINYAEGGYDSRQSLNNFLNLTDVGDFPQWAVFIEGVGDVASLCAPGVSLNTQGQEARMQQIIAQAADQSATLGLLVGPVRRVLAGLHNRGRGGGETCANSPRRAADVARVLIENWKVDRAVAQSYGIKSLMVLQPVAYVGHARTDYLRSSLGEADQYINVYRQVFHLAKTEKVDWITDMTGITDGAEPLYIDHFHLNREGNRIMATKLADLIGRAAR